MPGCLACGAEVASAAQCPRCGAPIADDDALELAVEPRAVAPDPPAPMSRPAPMSAPAPRRDGRSFQERQAAHMREYWRVARVPILVILGWFTLSHLALGSTWVFIDYVNLALHEAGHLLFRPFGTAAHFLGGTLGQLLWPLAFAIYFAWRQRDYFATAVCVWWFGENFIGIARYMADAEVMELPLVGGGIHDWNYLFTRWDVLDDAASIANTTWWIGALIMLPALGYLVYRTVRPSERDVAGGMDAPPD